jgi:hypothetical protein
MLFFAPQIQAVSAEATTEQRQNMKRQSRREGMGRCGVIHRDTR